jgi:hypothetical protein
MQENNTQIVMPKKKDWLPSINALLALGVLPIGLFPILTILLGLPSLFSWLPAGLIFVISLYVLFRRTKIWNTAWMSLADELNLQFVNLENRKDPNDPKKDISFPEMQGVYQGYPIHIKGLEIERGVENSHSVQAYTQIEIYLKNRKNELLIISNQRHLNMPTIMVEDIKFTREFFVEGNNPEFARIVLATPEQRQRLIDLKRSKFKNIEIIFDGVKVVFRDAGHILNSVYMCAVLNRLTAFARDIDQELDRH